MYVCLFVFYVPVSVFACVCVHLSVRLCVGVSVCVFRVLGQCEVAG